MKVSFLSKTVDFLNLFGSTIIICYSLYIIQNFRSSNTSYLSSLQKNWSRSPIINIIEAISELCPTGYTDLIEDENDGTLEGCQCASTITIGPCTSKDCVSIPSTNKSKIPIWRGKRLCALRGDQNYYNQVKAPFDGTCKLGLSQCGNLDSLGNLLCIDPLKSSCPLNDIKIVNANDILDPFYSSILIGNSKKLIFTNKRPNGAVVVEAKVSENAPCVDPNYKNSQRSIYVLDNHFDKYICPSNYTDRRFISIDKTTLTTVLSDNNLTAILYTLPKYPSVDLSNEVSLFYRNYIGVLTKCSSTLNASESEKSFNLIISNSDTLNKYGRIVAFFNIVVYLFLLFAYFGMKYYYAFTENNNIYNQTILKAIAAFWYSIIFCLNLALYVFLNVTRRSYSTILPSSLCGDAYNDRMIVADFQMIENMKSTYLVMFVFAMISAIFVWVDNLLCYHSIVEHEKGL